MYLKKTVRRSDSRLVQKSCLEPAEYSKFITEGIQFQK